jgi:DNA-directed RNA polymerase subunit omega
MADNMLRPSIGQIMNKKNESPYMVVVAVARRARQITEDASQKKEIVNEKPVKTAVNDFFTKRYKITIKDSNN